MPVECVNRSERIRNRGWKKAQQGDLDAYQRLIELGLEAHTVRAVGKGVLHVGAEE